MDNGNITSVLVSNSEWYGCNRLQFNHKKANKSMKRAHFSWVTLLDTVRCPYNAINLLPNPHQRHPIARPLRSVFCGFKLFFLHFVQFVQKCLKYYVLLDVMPALLCISVRDQRLRREHCTVLIFMLKYTPKTWSTSCKIVRWHWSRTVNDIEESVNVCLVHVFPFVWSRDYRCISFPFHYRIGSVTLSLVMCLHNEKKYLKIDVLIKLAYSYYGYLPYNWEYHSQPICSLFCFDFFYIANNTMINKKLDNSKMVLSMKWIVLSKNMCLVTHLKYMVAIPLQTKVLGIYLVSRVIKFIMLDSTAVICLRESKCLIVKNDYHQMPCSNSCLSIN